MRLMTLMLLSLACFASSALGADGVPVMVVPPSPTPPFVDGLRSFVNGIPGGDWAFMGLLSMIVGGILDVIARRWPTAKPRDVLRAAAGFIRAVIVPCCLLIAQGVEKLAVLVDKIIPPVLAQPPAQPAPQPAPAASPGQPPAQPQGQPQDPPKP